MAKCFTLIGVPASGKSTWRINQNFPHVVVSTDEYIEQLVTETGKTHNVLFTEPGVLDRALERMNQLVEDARTNNTTVVWDQTNLTRKSRKKVFRQLPDHEHVAVVFDIPDNHLLKSRIESRKGKYIPDDVIEGMKTRYSVPGDDEPFETILFIDCWGNTK